MKVGLIDVDGRNFPNLALMRIAAYHRAKGDSVEWVNYFNEYDKVYKSKVFTFSREDGTQLHADEVVLGGTGYDIKTKLAPEVDSIAHDYTIYHPMFTDAYWF